MKKALESNISCLTLDSDESSKYLCELLLHSGRMQRPTWRGLYRYWTYAKPGEVEYMAASHSGCYAVFCITVASGQGGIIAVWNTRRRRWEHVSESSYVACAMVLEEIPAVLTFHYVQYWGVAGHHSLLACPLNRTRQGEAEISLPVAAMHSKDGFNPKLREVKMAAYGDFVKNDQGPLGIFLLQDGVSLFAHDAGNLYETSIEAVKDALKSKNDPSEQDGIVEGGGMAVD